MNRRRRRADSTSQASLAQQLPSGRQGQGMPRGPEAFPLFIQRLAHLVDQDSGSPQQLIPQAQDSKVPDIPRPPRAGTQPIPGPPLYLPQAWPREGAQQKHWRYVEQVFLSQPPPLAQVTNLTANSPEQVRSWIIFKSLGADSIETTWAT